MSKRVTNSQFGMCEFCHILGFRHPYKLRNIVLNFLEIFHRKFDIGLAGYRSGPKPPLNLKLNKKLSFDHKKVDCQKELKFHLQGDRPCFFNGPLRCDPSQFVKKVIVIVFRMKFAAIGCDSPCNSIAIRSPLFFGRH